MPFAAPGTPQVMGGNDPVRSAAMSRLRNNQVAGGPTTPNQLPQGQMAGQPQPGPQMQAQQSPVAQLLAQAGTLFVERGAVPEDIEAIKGFLAFIQEVAESSAGQPMAGGQPMAAGPAPQGQVGSGVGAGPLPQMSAQGSPTPTR